MTYALSFSYPRSGYTKCHPARLESDIFPFRYSLRYFLSFNASLYKQSQHHPSKQVQSHQDSTRNPVFFLLVVHYSREIEPFTKATETISSIGTSNGA